MVDADKNVRCGKLECEIVTTGICADGQKPPESCPYYGRPDAGSLADSGEQAAADDASGVADLVRLSSGEALSPDEVDAFLRWRPATFVTVVGDRDSGKTTLICAIYDRFLRGPFAGHLFAGSRTLIGLEKRSHYARADSGRAEPDTPHTSLAEGLRFFHFAVALEKQPQSRCDLMLSDRAGEVYRKARSNSALVADLVEVAKANRLVLLLDGGRVANPVERAGAMQAVRQALRAFLDGGLLNPSSVVQVVTTKIDLLEDHPENPVVEAQLAAFRTRLVTDFASRLADLSFWDISARDPRGRFSPGHGLARLLTDWVTPRPAVLPRFTPAGPLHSEFDRLLARTRLDVRP